MTYPWDELASLPDPDLDDHGEALLGQLQDQLQMDDEWVDRRDRTLTWWGCATPLVLTVSTPRRVKGDPMVKITATTRIADRVGVDPASAFAIASTLNMYTVSGALWVDPEDRSLHHTVTHYAHPGNQTIVDNNILSLLLVLGYGWSALRLEAIATAFSSAPTSSPHPHSGVRDDLDELLYFPMTVAAAEPGINRWRSLLSETVTMLERQGIFAMGDDEGITAEFPFSSNQPAAVQVGLGILDDGLTALYVQRTDQPHPQLGEGMLSLLQLPDTFDPADSVVLANGLNWAEANELTGFPAWGAWVSPLDDGGGGELDHVLFSPSVGGKRGVASIIGFHAGMRTLWAQERLLDEDLVRSVRGG